MHGSCIKLLCNAIRTSSQAWRSLPSLPSNRSQNLSLNCILTDFPVDQFSLVFIWTCQAYIALILATVRVSKTSFSLGLRYSLSLSTAPLCALLAFPQAWGCSVLFTASWGLFAPVCSQTEALGPVARPPACVLFQSDIFGRDRLWMGHRLQPILLAQNFLQAQTITCPCSETMLIFHDLLDW